MTLSKSNTLYKFITRYGVVPSTNLCNLFWQTFFMTLGLFIAGWLVGMYLMGGIMLFLGIFHPASILFALFTFVGAVVGIGAGIFWLGQKGKLDRLENIVDKIDEVFNAIKDKYCPLVSWKE